MNYETTTHRKYELHFIFILRMDHFVILWLVLSILDEFLSRFSHYRMPIKIAFIVQLRKKVPLLIFKLLSTTPYPFQQDFLKAALLQE